MKILFPICVTQEWRYSLSQKLQDSKTLYSTTNVEKERKLFEKWAKNVYHLVQRTDIPHIRQQPWQDYTIDTVGDAWTGWLASRGYFRHD